MVSGNEDISVRVRWEKSEAETGESALVGKPGRYLGESLKPGPTTNEVEGGKSETFPVWSQWRCDQITLSELTSVGKCRVGGVWVRACCMHVDCRGLME